MSQIRAFKMSTLVEGAVRQPPGRWSRLNRAGDSPYPPPPTTAHAGGSLDTRLTIEPWHVVTGTGAPLTGQPAFCRQQA